MPSLFKLSVYIAILAFILAAVNHYMAGGWCYSKARIDGKVVIVTGANTGIGKETTLDLVNRGGKVYMACRSLERCNKAALDIKAETKADDRVIVMKLDLSSMKSVREFAKEFSAKEKKLHILINNAGVMWIPERTLTEDGFEMHFGINHLGHFLLTNLLMDQLFAAKPSRVVTVSSMGHTFTDIDFDDLQNAKEGVYGPQMTYSRSKLANVLFTKELGKRAKGFGVTTYSLNPGAIETELARHSFTTKIPYLQDVIFFLVRPFTKTPTEGAQTQICCAVDENLAEETGKYYGDCAEKEPSIAAQSEESAARLWDLSVELVKLTKDEIHPLLR